MWLDQVDTLQYFTFSVLHFKQPTKTFSFYNNTIVKYTHHTEHKSNHDKTVYCVCDHVSLNLLPLPGEQYTVSVYQVVSISTGETREVTSEPVSAVFTTKPLAPRDVSTEQGHIIISPSPSPSVKWDQCLQINRKQVWTPPNVKLLSENVWDFNLYLSGIMTLSLTILFIIHLTYAYNYN